MKVVGRGAMALGAMAAVLALEVMRFALAPAVLLHRGTCRLQGRVEPVARGGLAELTRQAV